MNHSFSAAVVFVSTLMWVGVAALISTAGTCEIYCIHQITNSYITVPCSITVKLIDLEMESSGGLKVHLLKCCIRFQF